MCDYRESRENWEWANLAPYASHSSDPSLAWRRSDDTGNDSENATFCARPVAQHFPVPNPPINQSPDLAGALSRFKTAFQVDKERITSSTAFRRLEYKTQMFVSHEGDHFRTRLTHTIEVDETARFIAQALRLNEDLVEAIAMGHDLGHTPFGHAGEATLDKLFRKYWPEKAKSPHNELYGPAFYHNVQGVRVVDALEKGYEWDRRPTHPEYNLHQPVVARGHGMDLTWAVREGILKHSSRGLRKGQVRMFGSKYLMEELDPFQPATLEGQVVEFADEIASIMHDLEDGLRSRLFTLHDLRGVLSRQVTADNLLDLLGLTARFGHEEDPHRLPRVHKLQHLLKVIQEGDDCTNGTVLAFLRSLLVSNVIETTYWRLLKSMSGRPNSSVEKIAAAAKQADRDELIWIHLKVGDLTGPTAESYCPEAWEIDPGQREVTVQTFRRCDKRIEPTCDPTREPLAVFWVIKSLDPVQSQNVIVKRKKARAIAYPLGKVCLTYSGAKLVGYDENLLGLRNCLRREFIPGYLHNASIVRRMNDKGQRFLNSVFELYFSDPTLIHRSALEKFNMWELAVSSPHELQKRKSFLLRIIEHLQGMTDRYLTEEYTRLFLPGSNVGERDEMCIVDGGKPSFKRKSNTFFCDDGI